MDYKSQAILFIRTYTTTNKFANVEILSKLFSRLNVENRKHMGEGKEKWYVCKGKASGPQFI